MHQKNWLHVPFYQSRLVFFNLFLFTAPLRSLKKFDGTPTWLKMTIFGTLCGKLNINKSNSKFQNLAAPLTLLAAPQLGIIGLDARADSI